MANCYNCLLLSQWILSYSLKTGVVFLLSDGKRLIFLCWSVLRSTRFLFQSRFQWHSIKFWFFCWYFIDATGVYRRIRLWHPKYVILVLVLFSVLIVILIFWKVLFKLQFNFSEVQRIEKIISKSKLMELKLWLVSEILTIKIIE